MNHWICMLLGHDFKVAYDREEGNATVPPGMAEEQTFLEDLRKIIIASKPCDVTDRLRAAWRDV